MELDGLLKLRAALAKAAEVERGACEFYSRAAAENFPHDVRALFADLAEFEDSHLFILESRLHTVDEEIRRLAEGRGERAA